MFKLIKFVWNKKLRWLFVKNHNAFIFFNHLLTFQFNEFCNNEWKKKKKISITTRTNQIRCNSSLIEEVWCKHLNFQFFKKREIRNIHFSFLFLKTCWEITSHLCIHAFFEIFIFYQNFCSTLFIYICELSFDSKHIYNIIFFFADQQCLHCWSKFINNFYYFWSINALLFRIARMQ